MPFYLDQGRGWRAEAAQRRRGGLRGLEGRLGAGEGGEGVGALGREATECPRAPKQKKKTRNGVLLVFAHALAVAVCCLCHVSRDQAVFRLPGSSFVIFKNYHTTP